MSQEVRVATPYGEGRLVLDAAPEARAVLLLSHGAGNGIEARDLAALARALPGQGLTVALFEQPWRVAGRTVATAPPTLDVGLRAAASALSESLPSVAGVQLVVGGRSAGARSAARCARDLGAAGVLAVAFPLHPPGRPEKSRVEELLGAGVPTLVVQGERDSMGTPGEFPAGTDLVVVPAADHGLKVPARGPFGQDEALALVVRSVVAWVFGRIVAEPDGNP